MTRSERPFEWRVYLTPGVFMLAALVAGCYSDRERSPTTGTLAVRVAESVAPPVIRQVEAFHALYADRGARIQYEVVSSLEAVKGFVRDTFQLAVTVDSLLPAEYQMVDEMDGSFLVRTAAFDGIAVVVHLSNPVEEISTMQLRTILDGTRTRWRDVGSGGSREKVSLVLQSSSDISRYLERTVLGGSAITSSYTEARTSKEVLDRVGRDPAAVGFVGSSWLDSASTPVKQLSVLMDHKADEAWYNVPDEARGIAYSPHPANVLRGYYPFSRRVYLLSRAAVGGDLATGFGAYILNSAGQKIFFEAGMIPATQTIQLRR